MVKSNILLICGGGGEEHEISLVSANYIKESLKAFSGVNVYFVEIKKDGSRINDEGQQVELRRGGFIYNKETGEENRLNFAIPCIHGPPGESGEIQSVFELMGLPYLGCGPEASILCFNKVSTKLWLNAINVPNTPFLFLDEISDENLERAKDFFNSHKSVYIKASNQGSSVGCYFVENEEDLLDSINKAFKLSQYVIIEKNITGRELEVAVYEYKGIVHASLPGEIICPGKFYDYDQKYSASSKATTEIVARDISETIQNQMKDFAIKSFKKLKLRDLSRVDFFLTDEGEILLNEINTFPGMTPISMFPKMMENNGLKFSDFIQERVSTKQRS